jgi:hypothetical protein
VLLVLITLGLALVAISYFTTPFTVNKRGGGSGGKFGSIGGGASSPLGSSGLPAVLSQPLAAAVTFTTALLRFVASLFYRGVVAAAVLGRRLVGSSGAKKDGPAYSSRGLGHGSASSGGSGAKPLFSGVSYDAVPANGRGGALPHSAAGGDEEAAQRGADDEDFGFGVDRDDEDGAAASRLTETDLLGIGAGSGGLGGGSVRPPAADGGAVPVLRPPRSHDASVKARHQ